jgi:hypothetical protein
MGLSATDKLGLERFESETDVAKGLDTEAAEKFHRLRARAKTMAEILVETCPDNRERQLAIDQLAGVLLWANASLHPETKTEPAPATAT